MPHEPEEKGDDSNTNTTPPRADEQSADKKAPEQGKESDFDAEVASQADQITIKDPVSKLDTEGIRLETPTRWRARAITRDPSGVGHIREGEKFLTLSEFARMRRAEKARMQAALKEGASQPGDSGRAGGASANHSGSESSKAGPGAGDSETSADTGDDEDWHDEDDEDEEEQVFEYTRELCMVVNGVLLCRHGVFGRIMANGSHRTFPAAFWAYVSPEEVSSIRAKELRERKCVIPGKPLLEAFAARARRVYSRFVDLNDDEFGLNPVLITGPKGSYKSTFLAWLAARIGGKVLQFKEGNLHAQGNDAFKLVSALRAAHLTGVPLWIDSLRQLVDGEGTATFGGIRSALATDVAALNAACANWGATLVPPDARSAEGIADAAEAGSQLQISLMGGESVTDSTLAERNAHVSIQLTIRGRAAQSRRSAEAPIIATWRDWVNSRAAEGLPPVTTWPQEWRDAHSRVRRSIRSELGIPSVAGSQFAANYSKFYPPTLTSDNLADMALLEKLANSHGTGCFSASLYLQEND